jgi:hypothetical protein
VVVPARRPGGPCSVRPDTLEDEDVTDDEGLSRRRLLKGMGVAGAAAWTTPMIAGAVLNAAKAGSDPANQKEGCPPTTSGTTLIGCGFVWEVAQRPNQHKGSSPFTPKLACDPTTPPQPGDFNAGTTAAQPIGTYDCGSCASSPLSAAWDGVDDLLLRQTICINSPTGGAQVSYTTTVDDTAAVWVDGTLLGATTQYGSWCNGSPSGTVTLTNGVHIVTARATNCGEGAHTFALFMTVL